jgi:hypothetical protein
VQQLLQAALLMPTRLRSGSRVLTTKFVRVLVGVCLSDAGIVWSAARPA